jgi:predicted RNase H-like HicB family nuclease
MGYAVAMQIDFTVHLWKEDGQYIAHALPLDLASAGPTPDAARQALDEAVRLFLATAAEQGTLTEVLEDAGYVREANTWRAPDWLAVEKRAATVPA